MKSYFYFVLLLLLFSSMVIGQPAADLVLESIVTSDYEAYLWDQAAQCDLILETPAADSATMNAYAKRAIIHMALIHVDSRNFVDDAESTIDSLARNGQRLDDFFIEYFESINFEHVDSMLVDLKELFLEPTYSEMKGEWDSIMNNFGEDFDSLGSTIETTLEAQFDHLERIQEDIGAIQDSGAAFEVSVQILGAKSEEVIILHEYDFAEMDSVMQYTTQGMDDLFLAMEQLDSLQNNEINPAKVTATFQSVVDNFHGSMDELESLLTTEPLSVLEVDTSFISDVNNILNEADSVLAGTQYDIGKENKTIRPLAFLENSLEELWQSLKDFYLSDDRYNYTFNNLFPLGLPMQVVDRLGENMVINDYDSDEEMDARMEELKADYLAILNSDPDNSEAHFGLAYTMTYLHTKNLILELEDFIAYMDAADFRQDFDWVQFKNNAVADSITYHFEQARMDEDLIFTVIILTDGLEGYDLSPAREFQPIYILNPHLEVVKGMAETAEAIRNTITDVFENIYTELDSMFILDLDPNYLDFSEAETEMDYLNILEQSNPHFLDITPYGVQKFEEAGEELRKAFSHYALTAGYFEELIDAMALHENDLGMDGQAMQNFASGMYGMIDAMNTDFQFPDSSVMMNGERVNLSAWFDNPPDKLLQRLKWYFDDDEDTDNTLGGLFPDRGFGTAIENSEDIIPNEYYLSQNFPNPFNPQTTIGYTLPKAGNVVISIYNILGQHMVTILDAQQNAGFYTIKWNADKVPAGIYFYKIEAGSFTDVKKCLLVK